MHQVNMYHVNTQGVDERMINVHYITSHFSPFDCRCCFIA